MSGMSYFSVKENFEDCSRLLHVMWRDCRW